MPDTAKAQTANVVPLANRFLGHLRHIPGQPVAYLQNPKAACTAIQLTLWYAHSPETAPANPNERGLRKPFVTRGMLREAKQSLVRAAFFSVVRNPYTRLVAAYLDKTLKPWNWGTFSGRFGYTRDEVPSLDTLLAAMLDMDPTTTDKHFRPQNFNLVPELAPLDFVGHVERMGEVQSFLSTYGMPWRSVENHTTKANERIREYLTPRSLDTVQRYYARDFELFGYGEDPAVLAPIHPVRALYSDREPLRRWLESQAR